MQRRLRLEGESLEDLRAQAHRQFPRARIVSAERVRVGGIAGFLARQHFELVLELPDGGGSEPQVGGLDVLLASADAVEESMRAAPVSTESPRFAEMLDALTQEEQPVVPASPPSAPAPLRGPGDLVLVLGPERAALEVGAAMLGSLGVDPACLLRAGTFNPQTSSALEARNQATRARAAGVEDGHATVIAVGLGRHGADPAAQVEAVRAMAADQVWLVVDAGRKPDDTARYVQDVRVGMVVDALAVEGAAGTATPETVTELGVPIGWVDGSALADSPEGLASVYTLQ
ncbi:hypothetical protein EXU48_00075 [Occultella glacieicola]|uniref:Uncharacterized protein n=1 Tax=Occultella glacieicola TaxID=2518684 RepID=A0ABY2E817_9MICO|nr:hypothetical protein [Occultella glacieicola]TDE98655.1 hypothetical protein EXU48_00075 [Occultella glacieicola]